MGLSVDNSEPLSMYTGTEKLRNGWLKVGAGFLTVGVKDVDQSRRLQ